MIFGLTPTVCSRAINWMLKKTVQALRGHPLARVQFPNREKMREYAALAQLREPLVDDIISFMDGVSFPAECTDNAIDQNAMYCGYDCDTMVNNVFAYGPDGKVFFAAINFPRTSQDAKVDLKPLIVAVIPIYFLSETINLFFFLFLCVFNKLIIFRAS